MADIITGQYVKIMQTPASIGERIAAQLIDWVVLAAYYTLYYVVRDQTDINFSIGFEIVVALLPVTFYTLLCEIFNHGQTIGKRVMKLRVVMKDGTVPSLSSYLLRWVLWLVDGPLLSFLGVVVICLLSFLRRARTPHLSKDAYGVKIPYTPLHGKQKPSPKCHRNRITVPLGVIESVPGPESTG